MKILNINPPYHLRSKCEHHFNLKGVEPLWTFGDTIYNPFNAYVDPYLEAHESVHCLQQGDNPEEWWDNYLSNKEFRFEQELKAYRVQYRVIKDCIKDRNTQARLLFKIAGDLSSPMYGSMVGNIEALKLIKK